MKRQSWLNEMKHDEMVGCGLSVFVWSKLNASSATHLNPRVPQGDTHWQPYVGTQMELKWNWALTERAWVLEESPLVRFCCILWIGPCFTKQMNVEFVESTIVPTKLSWSWVSCWASIISMDQIVGTLWLAASTPHRQVQYVIGCVAIYYKREQVYETCE